MLPFSWSKIEFCFILAWHSQCLFSILILISKQIVLQHKILTCWSCWFFVIVVKLIFLKVISFSHSAHCIQQNSHLQRLVLIVLPTWLREHLNIMLMSMLFFQFLGWGGCWSLSSNMAFHIMLRSRKTSCQRRCWNVFECWMAFRRTHKTSVTKWNADRNH